MLQTKFSFVTVVIHDHFWLIIFTSWVLYSSILVCGTQRNCRLSMIPLHCDIMTMVDPLRTSHVKITPSSFYFTTLCLTGRLIRYPQVTACFILCLDLSASNICNKMANMGCIPFNSFNMFNSNFPSMTCKQPMLP